jgi:serine kinase of HPr protein (carbohydrate metabolism regulator)
LSVIHAGLLAAYHRGAWRGVLIEGPSGCGKSDLALRLIGRGFSLVADDRVTLWTVQGRLYGAAPSPLRGLIEARGLGVLPEPARPFAAVWLIVQGLNAEHVEHAERVPEPQTRTLLGVACPLVRLRPLEASAPEKLCRALYGLVPGAKGGI